MNDKTKKIDWEAIELTYRAGMLSLRQIAVEHGISDTAIRKRAKRDRWTRDLSAKVRAKADDLVRREAVRSEVRTDAACEREIIEVNATQMANVLLKGRGDIQKARALVMRLLEELEQMTNGGDLLDQLATLMRDPEANADKLQEVYRKVISLPARVDTMKKLAEALKILIALEREAYGIDGRRSVGESIEDLLERLDEMAVASP